MKLVITGGHHSSALPVIKKLKLKYPQLEIDWLGHKHSAKGDKTPTLEFQEITGMGIPFHNLYAGKLYRTYNPVRLAKVPFGVLHALYLLIKLRPTVILSFGGYLAAPTVIAGYILRIPSLTHEQTVVAGYANKIIAKFARKIMISWPQSAKHFPQEKVVFTGIPLRPEIMTATSDLLELTPDLPTLYITTGKTGAHKINLAVENSLDQLLGICNIIHQCGSHSQYKDFETLTQQCKNITPKPAGKYVLKKFIFETEIGEVFHKADVLLTRAGAHITAEVLALEKPAILVPIPWVSHNEQYENAKIVESAGLGVILEEKDLTPRTLYNTVKQVLVTRNQFKITSAETKMLVRSDAVDLIVEQVSQFLK